MNTIKGKHGWQSEYVEFFRLLLLRHGLTSLQLLFFSLAQSSINNNKYCLRFLFSVFK